MKRTTARAAPVLVSLRGPPDPNAGERRAEGLAQELDTTTTLLHRSRRDRHSMDELAPARSRRSMGLSEGRRGAVDLHRAGIHPGDSRDRTFVPWTALVPTR